MGERFCPNITTCQVYAFLERQDFRDCMNEYCLGNHQMCERWTLRASGQHVPENLMPDGRSQSQLVGDAPADRQSVRTII